MGRHRLCFGLRLALEAVFLTLTLSGFAGFVSPHSAQLRGRRHMEVARHAGPDGDDKTVLILGGGIIGVSISYHLAQRGVKSTIVDRAGIASCASGKAGGFLARNWNAGTPTDELSQKSFDMHEETAKELSLSSYRRLKCQSVAVDGTGAKPAGAKLKNLELCDAMWSYSEQHGSNFVKGTVENLCYEDGDSERHIRGVVVDGQKMASDVVILSMGPWGEVLQQAVPACSMLGVKYHSVLMRSGRVLNEAVFFSGLGDPEVYPRNDGNHYVTGFPDPPQVVKEIPGEVEVREEMCSRLIKTMQQVSSEMAEAEVTTKQSCYLPFTRDSVPCMGKVPKHENVFVATGHGCWGILLSLASGKAMSELILDGEATSVSLEPFDPKRFG
ncbi:unnamed protein product [Durusdinium trenchii]|uniref:FAD dependent oxidoreductase domain-containing protein n=1 Tax=Durusdinium trenchii TaxID=1381693 RepID=A0ABP0RW55_9DINO